MVWISLTPTRRQCCIWMAMKENMSPPPHAVNILHIYLFWTWGTETLAKIFPHGPNHESSKSQPGKFVKVCVCVRGKLQGKVGGSATLSSPKADACVKHEGCCNHPDQRGSGVMTVIAEEVWERQPGRCRRWHFQERGSVASHHMWIHL